MPAINCVNINSKEFKNTVKDLNVSSGDLELIVHKFQNIEGNEDKFPSYLYIKKQLYGTPFRASDVQRRLYEKSGHARPLIFHGEDAYLNKLAELSKFYPKSAIGSYKNTEGDYIINIGIPFTTTDYKVSQIKNEDANKIRQELERLTKNFTDATHVTYELDRVKDFHIGFVSKEELYKILNAEVKKLNGQFGTQVTVDKNLKYHNNLEAEEEEYERLSKSLKDIESKIIEDKNIILKETLANILEEERRDAAKHEEELYNPYGYDAETMSAMPDIQFSVEKVTPEQVFFDNEIVPQIIDHLKAQGINVYNREKLIEYLKNHDYRKQQMAIEAEMQSIKQKAIADGTFMKAPNGQPTNLTERQWLQVRTKAFKDWFGDWEALANDYINTVEILNNDGSINFEKLEELTDNYFKNADESLFNKGRKTLREREEHHKGENNTFEHLQNVVKSAQNSNIADGLKNHVVVAAALHDIAKPFHKGNKHGFQSEELLNKIFKGKVSGLSKFAIAHHMMTIEERQEFTKEDAKRIVEDAKNRGLNINEAIDVLIALHIADITRGRNLEDIDEYSNKSIRDVINIEVENKKKLLEEAAIGINNNVSKVVDENGEPLVVYHGNSDTNIRVFGSKKGRFNSQNSGRYYFTKSKAVASTYTEEAYNADKFIIKGYNAPETYEDSYYDYLSYEDYKKSKDYKSGKIYPVFLNLRNPVTDVNPQSSKQSILRINPNADGFISYKVIDDYKNPTLHTDAEIEKFGEEQYVVFNPNQIKSATDNIGTFSRENDDIRYFTTPEGEVYGFLDKEGNIYLDETVIKPEHPIHEYTHLWDRAVQQRQPELWSRGVSLMKQTSLWNQILADTSYGQKWKEMGITGERLDNLIASEVHARFVGEGGQKLLNDLAKEKGQKGIIAKLKQWILDVWKALGKTFGTWSDEALNNLTLKDFNHLTMRDFAMGTPLKESAQQTTIKKEITYTPIGKQKQTYEIRDNKIFNKEGQEVFKEDSKDRRKIFANLAVKEDRAVVVEHKGKSYVVDNQDSIISVTSGDLMKWGEENGDRKAILQAAKEKFAEKQQSQNNTANQGTQAIEQETPAQDMSSEIFYDKQSANEYIQDMIDAGVPKEQIKIEYTKAEGDYDQYWTVKYPKQQKQEQKQDKVGSELTNSELSFYSRGRKYTNAAYNLQGMVTAISKGMGTEYWMTEEGSRVKQEITDLAKEISYTDAPVEEKINEALEYIPSVEDAEVTKIIENYLFGTGENTKESVLKNANEFYNSLEKKVYAEDNIESNEEAQAETVSEAPVNNNPEVAKSPTIEDIVGENNTDTIENVENTETSKEDLEDTEDSEDENDFDDEVENKRTPEEKKEAQRTLLEKAKKIEEQINNLNNNEYLTPSEVRRAADLAVYHISDLLTEACKSNENLERIFGIKTDTDVTTLSRIEVAKLIGGNNIISRLKAAFKNADFDDFDMLDKRDAILDNFEALMVIAQNTFLYMEDFSIISEDGKAYTLNTDINPDLDEGTDSNDADVINENEGSEQEHWQVETKTLDILGTMTPVVKQMLRECYVLNPDGSKVVTEWGVYDRVPLRQATNSIVRWIQGSITLRDAISKLKERQENNPWIKQVIDKLESENDQDSYLQSQFISVFLKPFQPYTIIVKENGKYKSITVNENPALKEAMKGIMALYKIQEHPMFTSDGTINKSTFDEFSKSLKELNALTTVQNLDLQNEETKKSIATNIGFIANTLGYTVTPEMVESILSLESLKTMKSALGHIENAFKLNIDNKNYDPFKYGAKGSIFSNLRAFLKPITEILEDTAISSVYDAGKMYQSYITPSYMTKLFQKFHNSNEESFLEFLQDEYGKYDWFRDQEEGDMRYGWRNSWLAIIAQNTEDREVLKHKTQLNFNKKQYMKDMDDLEYVLASITEYFSEYVDDGNPLQKAWFRVPMQSNKPSSEYIRFYSRNGSMYKQELTEDFLNIFNQELSRIQTVMLRNYSKTDDRFITNLDSNGRKFNFLEFFNDYLDGNNKDSELGKLINDKINGKAVDEVALNRLAKDQIFKTINDRVQRILAQFENQGILEAAKSIKGIEGDVKGHIENFLWNDTLAAMNIMELTITDIAYYKNAEDLQKRLAQLHAPGIRGNAEVMYHTANKITGEEGERSRVSDGLSRTIYLKDFDDYISNVIDNVSIVFDKKIAAAPENEKKVWEDLKESLVGEKGAYREINVADAQAYNSITSYRKKALIFGKWGTQAEQTYKKLLKGDYTISDIQMAFQPLKPFVYSQIPKSSNVANAPIKTFKMGVQNKNSEYLLILADALTQNEDTGIPNMLRVISEIMEESHYDKDGNYKNDGIDTVQFESTVKTGLMGRTDLTKYISMKNVGAATAKEVLLKHIYGADGKYNPTYVHEIPYEDYCLQQEVPEHFKNHEQSHGSQIRYIVVSELAETDGLGNKYTYTIRDGKKERKVSAKEFKEEYEKTISENIEQSISELEEEFGLSGLNMKDRNIALSKILQREILSSPRYGVDLLLACSVDENGRFRIPLGDPIQSKRVEQLINSIVKNRICKQTIAGGPIVQVSNFGTSKHLSIKFKDKQGNLLKTRNEFEGTDEEFKNYLKENQAGIAYFEVYAPIYANELLSKFADKNGNINIKAIEKLNPDLLKLVGYRIPTEAKYSMAPLKIVGFLPREAGDGIMMPYEITLLSGSDFDVDKEYVMRKVINIRDKYSNEIKKINKNTQLSEATKERERKKIIDNHSKNVKSALVNTLLPKFNNFATFANMVEINRAINKFLKDPFDEKTFTNEDGKLYNSSTYDALLDTYVNNMYDAKFPPRNSKLGRNNKIVDMTYEVLTHEQSCAEMLNPGGFEPQKRMGYLISAYKNPANKFTWKELESKTTKELKELSSTGKNLMYFDTHVQFYKQNSAAGSLIGIFAVHRTAHAALETDNFRLDVASLLGKKVQDTINYSPFKILNTSFDSTMEIDPRFDTSGQSVGKVLGSLVASAADAVKDPVLNLMNINSNTANILNTLVRLGMPFDDAALFLSQTAVENILTSFSKAKITKFKALNEIIKERIDKLKKELGITDDSPLFFEDITKKELIDGLRTPSAKTELKVLNAFRKIQTLSSALRLPTMATRFNSVTSAPGPMIIDNLATEFKLKKLNEKSAILDANLQPVDASHIFKKHPILNSFYKAQSIATQLLGNMPANSSGFRNLISYILDSNLGNTIINDRNLLSKLSDFYQTCLAHKGGIVQSEDLDEYINKFPKKFNSENYKETYKNNYLISSIKLDTDKQGRTYLYLDTTGIDAMDKEKLSSAWVTLHRENPELSTKLFKYCLFKGGVGFSPRTFMSLLPIQIKEKLGNYLQTYRVLPSLDEDLVINQFIRNNADSDKLVPKLTNEDKYTTEKDKDKNANIILDEKTSKKYFGDLFIKQSFKDSDLVLYQCVGTINDGKFTEGIPEILAENDRLVYKKVDALGSNKNYIEINMKESIEQSLDSKFRESLIDSKNTESETPNDIEKNKISDIDSTDNTEAKDNLDTVEDAVTQFYIEHIADSETTEDTQSNNNSLDEEIKAHIQDIFDRINIPYNKDFIDDFRNKLC